MQKKSKAGFTLVELMVVAIIVAILAAVAIPLMSANKKRAMFTEAESACGQVRTAQRVYAAEQGAYKEWNGTLAVAAPNNFPGIGEHDLDGKYFQTVNYSMASSTTNYTITCTGSTNSDLNGCSVSLDQDGNFTRVGY